MVHVINSNAVIVFSFLIITRVMDAFSNYFINIKALFFTFFASRLTPANAINRFSIIYSNLAKSRAYQNIYYSNSLC
jgi:hypothetical protein